MQTLPGSLLSIMVPDEQSSRLYVDPIHKQQFQTLRTQLLAIIGDFQKFKEQTLQQTKEAMGRISSLLFRSLKQRSFLEAELQKSKQMQNTMRSEVIQLKEMINEALKDYSRDIHSKDQEIRRLREELLGERSNSSNALHQEIRIEEHKSEEQSLEVIQEESEQTTFSSVTSLRQFREEDGKSSNVSKGSISIVPQSHFKEIEPPLQNSTTHSTENQSKEEHRKTKSFIDNFRKTIQQSNFHCNSSTVLQKAEIPKLNINNNKENVRQPIVKKWFKENIPSTQPLKDIVDSRSTQPLKDIANCLSPKYFTNNFKNIQPHLKDVYLQEPVSNSSSSSELKQLSDIQKESEINRVPVADNYNYTFLKKKTTHQRFKTQPDQPFKTQPDRPYPTTSHKPSHSFSKMDPKPYCERSFSDSKSIKSCKSKQKIRVTSRMMEDQYQPRKNHNAPTAKALVHLGGKSLFRKFLSDLKQAFGRYSVYVGSPMEEYQYVGELVQRMRWGRGRIIYRTGLVYEGEFRENKRHGRGSLLLNGIPIYEGDWRHDHISGQGYIKSMKFMTNNCPPLFEEASYCGNLQGGKLHGIGTIFLNQREKIVTKFRNGVPLGELTYYNLQEIEFGVWPCE